MDLRRRRLALVLAMMLTLVAAGVAYAADVPRLDGPVTDRAGVLDGDITRVEAALDALLRDHDVQLFVVFVATTDELTATEFADETARINSLGANDALLMVAVDDRTDAIWVAGGLDRITDAELDRTIADELEPRLRDGDFAGAAVATATSLGEAIAAEPTAPPVTQPPTTPPPGGEGTSGGGGGIDLGLFLGLVLAVVGVGLVARWLWVRRAELREAGERDRRTARLAREVNAQLIAVDERIRSADDEAGFVEAEYGADEAKPFRAAISEARDTLRAAFAIRQRLDDAEPEDPPTREKMLAEIVELLGRAGASLDREAARIEELRNVERKAPEILAALPAQIDAQEARLARAQSVLDGLRGYAESALDPIKGNLAEAHKGLSGARTGVEHGTAALARQETGRAAGDIHTAQEGIAGAAALIDAVDKLASALREAEGRLEDELRAADADLSAARSGAGSAAGAAPGPDHAADLAVAGDALRAARAAASAHPLDPLAAHRLATEAHRRADEVLARVRADAEQQARLRAAVEASLTSARADVDRAADFIATRRSGVGRQARTRLAEAERLLDTAAGLRATDPKAAMDNAKRAERLAEEAYSMASTDFDSWDRGGPGPARPGAGSNVGGAILGGIIGGILSGGGRRGGGWGGSPWGSSGPFGGGSRGGGGWGGGRSRGGGFGGFGGGGGGRSRGGRW